MRSVTSREESHHSQHLDTGVLGCGVCVVCVEGVGGAVMGGWGV